MAFDLKEGSGSGVSVWNHASSSYEKSRIADPVYSSCLAVAADAIPGRTSLCLDAGCGTGMSTIVLCDKSKTVVAIDYSFDSLRVLIAKGIYNVIAVQAELTALPFQESTFDACLCANTLQHLKPDGVQDKAVSELRRVTKKFGVLSVSVHHYSRTKKKSGWIKEGNPGQPGIDYIYRFTRNNLRELIPGAVIRGVGYYGLLRIPFIGSRLQNLLAILFGRIAAFLGYGHMLVARFANDGETHTP